MITGTHVPNAIALLVYQFTPEGQKPRILLTPGFSFVLLGSSLTMAKHEELLYSRSQNSRCFVVFFFFNVEEILCLGELLCLYSFYVFIFKPQGKRISWESITCHGWEIRFCAMIQRLRSDKAGCLWVTWKAAYTTKLVRSFLFFPWTAA